VALMARAQRSKLQRTLFQIHLWVGIALSLYVLLISLSGSAIVFRREMDRALCPGPGSTTACEPAFVTWLADFHDNLLAEHAGRLVNGIGAILVAVLAIAGLVIWWPGRSNWWRRMSVRRGVGGRRFTLDLHNMLGFWMFALIFIWALGGIYFAFPEPFNALAEAFQSPSGDDTPTSFLVQDALAVLARLHFGRAYGLSIKILWAILGLVPCILLVTGVLMWWWRVVRGPRVTR
jgi:uncharacterized iron-regulated membrane protein